MEGIPRHTMRRSGELLQESPLVSTVLHWSEKKNVGKWDCRRVATSFGWIRLFLNHLYLAQSLSKKLHLQ